MRSQIGAHGVCTADATGGQSRSGSAGVNYVQCMAETSYASCGDLSLACQVFGDGPVKLVFVGPMVSHVELFWAGPEYKASSRPTPV